MVESFPDTDLLPIVEVSVHPGVGGEEDQEAVGHHSGDFNQSLADGGQILQVAAALES